MNIPDKAIGAAEEAWYEAADLEAAIKAAAPFIAAQALRDYAETCVPWGAADDKWNPRTKVVNEMRTRADEMDPQ